MIVGSQSPKTARRGRKTYLKVQRFEKGKTRATGQKSLSKLKKELDRVFSLYIRGKYSEVCYTCGKAGSLQNGHFIVRQYLATRWDENNCRPQCFGCNIRGKGRTADFEEHLIQELGAEKIAELKLKRKELWRLDATWYETQIAHYKTCLPT